MQKIERRISVLEERHPAESLPVVLTSYLETKDEALKRSGLAAGTDAFFIVLVPGGQLIDT